MARRREGTAITPAVARAPCPTRWGRVRARHVPRQAARFATPNSAGVREGRGRGGVGGGRAKCASSGGGRRHALGGQSRGAGGGAGAVASRRDSGWALDGLQLGSQLCGETRCAEITTSDVWLAQRQGEGTGHLKETSAAWGYLWCCPGWCCRWFQDWRIGGPPDAAHSTLWHCARRQPA